MMNEIYSAFRLWGQFVAEFAATVDSAVIHIILDLPTGYALATSPSVPRPYLIITGNPCPLYLHDLLRLEPEGLIAPGGPPDGIEQVERAMMEITAGRRVYIGPVLPGTGLTARERAVVRLTALGRDNHAIARELGVSQKTVRNTLSGVLSKLGLKDRVELCYYYLGLLDVTRIAGLGQSPAERAELPG